jgi:hypothetical protein
MTCTCGGGFVIAFRVCQLPSPRLLCKHSSNGGPIDVPCIPFHLGHMACLFAFNSLHRWDDHKLQVYPSSGWHPLKKWARVNRLMICSCNGYHLAAAFVNNYAPTCGGKLFEYESSAFSRSSLLTLVRVSRGVGRGILLILSARCSMFAVFAQRPARCVLTNGCTNI